MPGLSLENVSTSYAIKDVNLTLGDGELMVLLGPSGAGKTTLLNVVAGLNLYTGSVYIGDKKVDHLKPSQRNVGYVFQDLCLFPHLTVYENVAFGLQATGASKTKIATKVWETLELLDMSRFQDRYPRSLSGGEKQRVALARALVLQPQIMLMDEPLSSVDFNLAKYLRREIKELQQKLNLTTLYVTHDFSEAKELADRIAVMTEGHLRQVGKADDIFIHPKKDIQHFIPAPNLLPCDEVQSLNAGFVQVKCHDLELIIVSEKRTINKIAILPQDVNVSLLKPPGPDINRFRGEITNIKEEGPFVQCEIKVQGNVLRAEVPKDYTGGQGFSPGQKVWVKVNMRKMQVV